MKDIDAEKVGPIRFWTGALSTNLGPGANWISLGNPTQTMLGRFEMTDPATNLPRRYYRVRSL